MTGHASSTGAVHNTGGQVTEVRVNLDKTPNEHIESASAKSGHFGDIPQSPARLSGHAHAPRAVYCCDLLSSSRSRTSSDTKRSARCHASSVSPRNWKYFRNRTRCDVASMAAVPATCTSVLTL